MSVGQQDFSKANDSEFMRPANRETIYDPATAGQNATFTIATCPRFLTCQASGNLKTTDFYGNAIVRKVVQGQIIHSQISIIHQTPDSDVAVVQSW